MKTLPHSKHISPCLQRQIETSINIIWVNNRRSFWEKRKKKTLLSET